MHNRHFTFPKLGNKMSLNFIQINTDQIEETNLLALKFYRFSKQEEKYETHYIKNYQWCRFDLNKLHFM